MGLGCWIQKSVSLPLATAEKIAAKIVAELAHFCELIEVAGSIRRRRPNVNDIDLVVLVKESQEAALRERCKRNAMRVQTDGDQSMIVHLKHPASGPDGLQLDIWFATPEKKDLLTVTPTNFGTLLLLRTGSRKHNIRLLGRAEQLGLRWNTYHGVFDRQGKCLARATEESIFEALKLPFVKPEDRET